MNMTWVEKLAAEIVRDWPAMEQDACEVGTSEQSMEAEIARMEYLVAEKIRACGVVEAIECLEYIRKQWPDWEDCVLTATAALGKIVPPKRHGLLRKERP